MCACASQDALDVSVSRAVCDKLAHAMLPQDTIGEYYTLCAVIDEARCRDDLEDDMRAWDCLRHIRDYVDRGGASHGTRAMVVGLFPDSEACLACPMKISLMTGVCPEYVDHMMTEALGSPVPCTAYMSSVYPITWFVASDVHQWMLYPAGVDALMHYMDTKFLHREVDGALQKIPGDE